ncbi:MAG: hypothetical protein Q7J47_03410 [Azoarcus sp.]|nr:hypothetical protein [Azoarcus sp.]
MTSYDKTTACYANQREQQLRKLLRDEFGTRKYRIVGQGAATEVHAYGTMPNTNTEGWFVLGGIKDVERRYAI